MTIITIKLIIVVIVVIGINHSNSNSNSNSDSDSNSNKHDSNTNNIYMLGRPGPQGAWAAPAHPAGSPRARCRGPERGDLLLFVLLVLL